MSKQRFVFLTDIHGDRQDAGAVSVALEFIKDFRPSIRVIGGDLWDFRPLRGKASDEERRQSMKEDFTAGKKFFHAVSPTHFLRGNHDERLWDLAGTGSGVMQDYAFEGINEITEMVKKQRCRMLPYNVREGVLQIGHLKMIHGFHCGVHADKQAALVYGSILMGHTHAISAHPIPGIERRMGRVVGCLCDLNMEYEARRPGSLRHAHGFAYGIIDDKTGNFQVYQAECEDGKWLLASDFKEYK